MGIKFNVGKVVYADNIVAMIGVNLSYAEIKNCVTRHSCGDHGDVGWVELKANRSYIDKGGQIMSIFTIKGVKFYVITEYVIDDDEVTTTMVLLPEDYC